MKSLKILPFVPLVFLIPQAQGEIIVQDSYAPPVAGGAPAMLDEGAGPFGYEIDLSPDDFQAAGHGKLIMVYSSKDEDGGDFGGAPVTSITYDGVALTEAFFSANDADRVTIGIYYLDNVASDGTLRIELEDGAQSEYGFGLYAVDGLMPGVQSVASGRGNNLVDATVTVTTETGFIVQEAARNNQTLTDDPEDDWETLYNYEGPQSYRALSQYRIVTEPGDYVAPVINAGALFKLTAAAAFEEGEGGASGPTITSLTPVGPDLWELALTGRAETGYEFYSSTSLDFSAGTLLENLTQGDAGDAGTVGGASGNVLTTDADGNGKVRVTLTGDPTDFVRAQQRP